MVGGYWRDKRECGIFDEHGNHQRDYCGSQTLISINYHTSRYYPLLIVGNSWHVYSECGIYGCYICQSNLYELHIGSRY